MMNHETPDAYHAPPATARDAPASSVGIELGEIAFLFAFLAGLIWLGGVLL